MLFNMIKCVVNVSVFMHWYNFIQTRCVSWKGVHVGGHSTGVKFSFFIFKYLTCLQITIFHALNLEVWNDWRSGMIKAQNFAFRNSCLWNNLRFQVVLKHCCFEGIWVFFLKASILMAEVWKTRLKKPTYF